MKITMPKLGLTMTEGTIQRWLVPEGAPVRKGEAMLEIETDKVVMEVEAPADGLLRAILKGANQTVPVGEEIALLEEAEGRA